MDIHAQFQMKNQINVQHVMNNVKLMDLQLNSVTITFVVISN